MAEERLIERLLDFGLAKYEAEAYLFLLRAGPCPARVVARKLRINRMKAYRTLKALEERGLVQVTVGRPVKFVAASLKEALDRNIEDLRVKVSSLEKSKKKIVDYLESLHREVELLEEPRFRIIQGRQQVYESLLHMFERAKEEILLVTTRNDLYRLSFAGIDDKLKVLDHVKTRVLTQVDPQGLEIITSYVGFAEVRHITLPTTMRLALIDGSEVLTTFAMDDSMSMTTQRDIGLWTTALNYAEAMKAFFGALWRTAPDAREAVEAIKTGRAPQEIRIIGTQEEYFKTYKAMIDSSNEEVIVMSDQIKGIPITVQDLQRISERDVKIRLLTTVDLESLPEINRIYRSVQVMHRASATSLRILIVDRREFLLQIPYLEAMGHAVWFNLKAYVDTMVQVFDNYWVDGVPAQEVLPKLATQQTLIEGLELAKKSLEVNGWIAEVPGKLAGDSGLEYSFSLVAKRLDRLDRTLALDMLIEEKPLGQVVTLGAKVMDVKPAVQLLAATKPFDDEDIKLAELYGIRLITAAKAQQLATKIMDEANKIFGK